MIDTLVESGLMTRALRVADRTERWDGSRHREILKRCDDHAVYTECGWTCLAGYQTLTDGEGKAYDRRRIVHVHFNSLDELNGVLSGCNLQSDGHGVYTMTKADRQRRRNARRYNKDYPIFD